ncbi:MAG TPA: DUF4347 domain-containing protein, partial [Afifellaceae bacterium]|nr:DUF4347 domain-containing protein [Afifellaceae bacterium]
MLSESALAGSLIALEQRFVFDAAGAVAAAETLADAAAQAQADQAVYDASDRSSDADASALLLEHEVPVTGPATTDADRNEIVFVDPGVADIDTLLAGISSNAEIVLLNSDSDGVEQIAAALEGRSDIDAIHILSHGSEGRLYLGNDVLEAGSMQGEHLDDLTAIGRSLSADGDILIYGCDFTSGDAGLHAASLLSDITGADVAASIDTTGHADFGGDWQLESEFGQIEARTLEVPSWYGTLEAFNISVSSAPTVTGGTGVGAVAVWTNAGTVGSTSIDLVAEVISADDPSVTVAFDNDGDDPRVTIDNAPSTGATVRIRWSVYESGTGQSVLAAGDPTFSIRDLDGAPAGGSTGYPDPGSYEGVAADIQGLQTYTIETGTHLTIDNDGSRVLATGTQNETGGPESMIRYTWANVTSWEADYFVSYTSFRYFVHDGDGDLSFSNPITVAIPQLDLDPDDSSGAAGIDYADSITPGVSTSAPIADIDVNISDADDAFLQGATITLTNPQAGDEFLIGGVAVASGDSGTVSGIGYTVSTGGSGEIVITLTGMDTVADYEAALADIRFSNTLASPSTVDRTITVVVNDNDTPSGVATATISVRDPLAPVANPDQNIGYITDIQSGNVLTGDANGGVADTDPDGGALTVTAIDVGSGAVAVPVGGTTVTVTSTMGRTGSLTINPDGSYSFNPGTNFTGLDVGESDTIIVSYTIQDPDLNTDTTTLILTVANPSPPVLDLDTTDSTPGPTITDNFESGNYSGGSGWSGNWTESFVGSGTGFDVGITTDAGDNSLYIDDDGVRVQRSADLSGVDTATLSFDYRRSGLDTSSDYIIIEVATSSSGPFVEIGRFEGPATDGSYQSFTADISDYISSDTTIRFATSGSLGNSDRLYVDNVTISTTTLPTDYTTSYTAYSAAVSIASSDVGITDIDSVSLSGATITLSNPQTGDALSIIGSLPAGISASISGSGDVVTLSGSATVSQYEAAIEAIGFSSYGTSSVDRTINVQVTDNAGEASNVAVSTIVVTVPPNSPPVVDSAIADQSSNDSAAVSLDVSGNFSDPDGDTLTYSATGLPTGLSISSAGVISGTLPADASQSGPYTIVVTANDGEGGTVTDTFTWTVNNPAPVVDAAIADQTNDDGDTVSLDVSGDFSDP